MKRPVKSMSIALGPSSLEHFQGNGGGEFGSGFGVGQECHQSEWKYEGQVDEPGQENIG